MYVSTSHRDLNHDLPALVSGRASSCFNTPHGLTCLRKNRRMWKYGLYGLGPDALRDGRSLGVKDGRGERVRYATWNIGTMTVRAGEVVMALGRRRIDVCCVQETRKKGERTGERWWDALPHQPVRIVTECNQINN